MNWTPELNRYATLHLQNHFSFICRTHTLHFSAPNFVFVDVGSFWGKWDPVTRTIFIAQRLVLEYDWAYVEWVMVHEMAHMLTESWDRVRLRPGAPHGEVFQRACSTLGLPAFMRTAQVDLEARQLDWHFHETSAETTKLMDKCKKLLALATSSNEHEAFAAMSKVRELYERYHLDHSESLYQEPFVNLRICFGKKVTHVHFLRIISILTRHFSVQSIHIDMPDIANNVILRGVELMGTRADILMAEYVYYFLLQQLESRLADQKKRGKVRGTIQIKSYRIGLLDGFDSKLEEEKMARERRSQTGLVLAKSTVRLDQYLDECYPGSVKTFGNTQRIDSSVFSRAQQDGRSIALHKPVESRAKGSQQLELRT